MKKQKNLAKKKVVYGILIITIPLYAAFTLQLIPRERTLFYPGQGIQGIDCYGVAYSEYPCYSTWEKTYDSAGWPIQVVVDQAAKDYSAPQHLGGLLANVAIISTAVYVLVLLSAGLRYKYMNQAPDGTKIRKKSK